MSEQKTEMTPYNLDHQWPVGKKSAFFTLGIVVVLGLFDFVDRQVLAALFPYLKAEYALTDTQLGMLVAVVNIAIAAMVIPSAYFIDRWSRKKMLALMAAIWSLATGACALAGSYGHLLVARVFIGTGQAGYHPAGQSLLTSTFPTRWRATVLGVVEASMSIGAPLGLLLGAFIAEHWGWRHAFGVVAIPGLIAAFCALFIKDFSSANVEKAVAVATGKADAKREPYLQVVCKLLKCPSLLFAYLGLAAMGLINGTLINWLPSYFIREAGMTPTEGSQAGAIILVAISVSCLLAGPLWDRVRRAAPNRANLGVALCQFGAMILMLVALMVTRPGSPLQIVLLALHALVGSNLAGVVYSVVADLSLPHQRATAVGLCIFVLNLLGYSMGPLLTGIMSDWFDLAHSLMVISCGYAISGICLLCVYRFYTRDSSKVQKVTVTFD